MSIAVSEMSAVRDEVLFCPFCEESFEGERSCPEHELALVPFEKLPRVVASRRHVRDDKDLPWWEPRFGRGLAAVGALAVAVGFLGPLAVVTNARGALAITGYALAATRLSGVWSIAVVPFVVLGMLAWRRSPERMRGLRAVVPLLGLAVLGVLAWALSGMRHWALALDRGSFSLAWGSFVVTLGAAAVIVGGLVLGLVPRSATVLPHGAEGDEPTGAITPEPAPEKPRRAAKKKRR